MPSIITRGAMSARALGFGKVSLGTNSWVSLISSGNENRPNSIVANSAGQSVVSYIDYATSSDPFLILSSTGTQVAGAYANTLNIFTGCDVYTDASGNIYYTGQYNSTTQVSISKANSSGTGVWSFKITYPSSNPLYTYVSSTKVTADFSGNVYITSTFRNDADTIKGALITKLNSSGSLQWSYDYRFSGSDGVGATASPFINNAGNLVISGSRNTSTTIGSFMAEINASTGAVISAYDISNIGEGYPTAVAQDANGNYYVAGGYQAGPNYPVIAKFDSSFSLQWAKYLSTMSGSGRSYYGGMALDDTGSNIYLANFYDAGGVYGSSGIAKISMSGTLSWIRSITYSSLQMRPSYSRTVSFASPYWYYTGYGRDPFVSNSTRTFAFQGVSSGGTAKTVGSWTLSSQSGSLTSFTSAMTSISFSRTATSATVSSLTTTTLTPTTTVTVFS